MLMSERFWARMEAKQDTPPAGGGGGGENRSSTAKRAGRGLHTLSQGAYVQLLHDKPAAGHPLALYTTLVYTRYMYL